MDNIKFNTFVELLRTRASLESTRPAYIFLEDGETTEERISYSELDLRARSVANLLNSMTKPGDRVMIIYPPGIDYIAAFFGCLYAGVIAVPAYPPAGKRGWPRLQAIISDCGSNLALTHTRIAEAASSPRFDSPLISNIRWINTDLPNSGKADGWKFPEISEKSIALLQYTSGSTSVPKGVILTHENLMTNEVMIHTAFDHDESSFLAGWLPPYHDMGLIGNLLQPVFGNFPCCFMAPAKFVEKPSRWLHMISRYRATTSGGPNFAYDLCCEKISDEEKRELDLSSWKIAFNGSEPVRSETIERFSESFSSCGFRKEAMFPCYGLAEASLFVSGVNIDQTPAVLKLDKKELSFSRIATAKTEKESTCLVSCGCISQNQECLIVESDSFEILGENHIGEIWIAGSNVSCGYWNLSEETDRNFGVAPKGTEAARYFRTGDLGFRCENELYVTGRLKDLVIIRGRNFCPQDIELTVANAHPKIRSNCVAAFSSFSEDAEQLIIVAELSFPFKNLDYTGIAKSVHEAVVAEYEIEAASVVLVKTGGIPKTTSGKIRRIHCRELFIAGELPVIEEYAHSLVLECEHTIEPQGPTELWLVEHLCKSLGIAPNAGILGHQISGLGLDSMKIIEHLHKIEEEFSVSIPFSELEEIGTVRDLAKKIRSGSEEIGMHEISRVRNREMEMFERVECASEEELDRMLAELNIEPPR